MRFISLSLVLSLLLTGFQSPARAETVGEVVSRVQTNLNRVAAGLDPIASSSYPLAADRLVDVLDGLLSDDPIRVSTADRLLSEIEVQTYVTLRRLDRAISPQSRRRRAPSELLAQFGRIESASSDKAWEQWRSNPWFRFSLVANKVVKTLAWNDWSAVQENQVGAIRVPCILESRVPKLPKYSGLRTELGSLTTCPSGPPYADVTPPRGAVDATRFVWDLRAAVRSHQPDIGQPDDPGGMTWRWARLHMADQPIQAEALLRASADPEAKYQHALYLFFFRPPSVERDESIRRDMGVYLTYLRETWEQGNSEYDIDKEPELVSRLSVGELVAGRIYTDEIPCLLLVKVPGWVAVTEPAFGSTRDYFLPRSGCDERDSLLAGFPFREFREFHDLANAAAVPFSGGGSIRYSLFTDQLSTGYWLMFDPSKFASDSTPSVPRPYQTWGYQSLSNQSLYRRIAAVYPQLKEKLARFYRRFGLEGAAAERVAEAGLYEFAFGADCGAAPPPPSFRKLLLDDAGVDEIEAFAKGNTWHDGSSLAPFRNCGDHVMDPLAHIAVVNVPAFEFLQNLCGTLPPERKLGLDCEMAIDERNSFGKTPLMTAAQHDRLDAVAWLLQNGADVAAVTDTTSLAFGRRTALMYAAASASIPVISALLNAGADPHQADTMGKSAIDYLLGAGPEGEPPNPNIPDSDFKVAYDLLR